MSFQRFIIASALLHLLIFTGLYLNLYNKAILPEKEETIMANLITPRQPELRPAPPKPVIIRPAPKIMPPVNIPKPKINEPPPTRLSALPRGGAKTHSATPPSGPAAPLPGQSQGTAPLSKVPPVEPDYSKGGKGGTGTEGAGKGKISRPNLLDQEIIAKEVEKSEQKDRQDEAAKEGITFSTDQFKYLGYMERLKSLIEGIWVYPRAARERGLYGDLRIVFTIKKNGDLGSVKIMKTSGYSILDEAAVKALRDAAPFWPLPNDWGTDAFTIDGRFYYINNGGMFVR